VPYWGGGYYGGGINSLAISPGPLAMGLPETKFTEKETEQEMDADKHLRSTDKVTGYTIKASDGEIGEVEDFIFDEVKWEIDFVIVDTGSWLPGKKVLISPKLINEIEWDNSTISVETSVEFIKRSPEYDPTQIENIVELAAFHENYEAHTSHL